jgi:hypothetical protein
MDAGDVIVKLSGGLGSQMFQYALGRRLSIEGEYTLKLDTSWFKTSKDTHYGLNHFNIEEVFATPKEVRQIKNNNGILKYLYLIANKNSHITETNLSFNPDVLITRQKNIYLDGFWQNEKYFNTISNKLRSDFRVKTPSDLINKKLADKLLNINAVAVHVRCGVDKSKPEGLRLRHICDQEYYIQAMEHMANKIDDAHFVVFSDNPVWAKKYLVTEEPMLFVNRNAQNPYEDLKLMNHCKHFIISNSAFGWWSAWLSPYKNKRIIAPLKWFENNKINKQFELPVSWIRI